MSLTREVFISQLVGCLLIIVIRGNIVNLAIRRGGNRGVRLRPEGLINNLTMLGTLTGT